jgi:hypothetical protein
MAGAQIPNKMMTKCYSGLTDYQRVNWGLDSISTIEL